MKINKNNINNYFKSYCIWVPFIFLFIILVSLHFFLSVPTNDDIWFANQINKLTKFNNSNFLIFRYMHWSSRILIEFFLTILSSLPTIIWKFLDSILFLIIGILTPKIILSNFENLSIKKKFTYNTISSILLLSFICTSFNALGDAGYIATTLNYIWPFGFGVIHFYLVKKYILKKVTIRLVKKVCIYIMMIFSLLFATNMEMMLAIIFGVYLFILIYLLYKKIKIPKILFLFLGIIILVLINVIICPGNHERFFSEVNTWFPEYLSLSLFNKIDLGTTTFFHILITKFNLVFYIFFGIHGIYTFIISKKKKIAIIGFIPFIILSFFYYINFIHYKPLIDFLNQGFGSYGLLYSTSSLTYIMISSLVYLLIILPTIYSLILIKKYRRKKSIVFVLAGLLLLAFCSQFIVGFTPTIWASEGRLWIICWGIMIFPSALLFYDFLEHFSKK